MLKKMIPLGLALAILVPTIASAKTVTAQENTAKSPYATEIKAERQTIKTNHDANKVLRDTIKAKLAQVKTLIAQDKANKTLKDKKADLQANKALRKADRATLKGINTTLKADRASVKADKANKDYTTLLADLKKIPDLQTSKTPILQDISSKLDSLISLLTN